MTSTKQRSLVLWKETNFCAFNKLEWLKGSDAANLHKQNASALLGLSFILVYFYLRGMLQW
jgi:hypothetical protein